MEMEMRGMKLNVEGMNVLSVEMGAKQTRLHDRLLEVAGRELNLESPKQLADLLFGTRGLKPIKAGKSGMPSTDEEVLTKYANDGDEFCKLLIEYRQLTKMCGTYIDALPRQIASDGRLHPSFNIEGTATGRLSCDSPNLQNIPKGGDLGKQIRQCFIPEKGNIFIRADYSQMELRMLAHVSNDPYLIYALRTGEDLHARTARAIFGKDEITEDERTKAKAVNFGTIYGMSPHGLAKSIDSTLEEARLYLNQYFRMYPLVREWKWEAISYTRDQFLVKNIFGRTRVLKISDGNLDRIALNTPIQGSCADLVKIAMIRLKDRLVGMDARIKY
jgi:DNA polymerase-1